MDLRSSKVIGMAWNLRSACRNRWSASSECAQIVQSRLELRWFLAGFTPWETPVQRAVIRALEGMGVAVGRARRRS